MQKTNIQILLSDAELLQVKKDAEKNALTVPLYIKSKILNNDIFISSYKTLLNKVDLLPKGVRFNIKALFGVEWTMDKGIRLNLGKTYYTLVKNGTVSNVKPIGKDSSNVMWYEKL